MEALAVEGDDAGGFLAAVLKCVETQCSDGSGFRVAEYAEDTAFFAQPISIKIEIEIGQLGLVHRLVLRPRALCTRVLLSRALNQLPHVDPIGTIVSSLFTISARALSSTAVRTLAWRGIWQIRISAAFGLLENRRDQA